MRKSQLTLQNLSRIQKHSLPKQAPSTSKYTGSRTSRLLPFLRITMAASTMATPTLSWLKARSPMISTIGRGSTQPQMRLALLLLSQSNYPIDCPCHQDTTWSLCTRSLICSSAIGRMVSSTSRVVSSRVLSTLCRRHTRLRSISARDAATQESSLWSFLATVYATMMSLFWMWVKISTFGLATRLMNSRRYLR